MKKEENWDDFCMDHFGMSESEFTKEVIDEALDYAKHEARAEAKPPKTVKESAKPKIEPAVTIPSPVGQGIDFGVDLPVGHPWRTERKSIFACPPKEQEPRKEESHGQTHRYSVEASEGRRGWMLLTLDNGALVLVPRTAQKPKYLTVSEEGHKLVESRKSDSAWILDNNLIINIL